MGSFWQPVGVLCDTETLASLPDREWRSGHGEMAKYAFFGVEDLDRLELGEQVARCVACKAEVVAGDEREGGRRVILNYGHTLAPRPRGGGSSRARTPSRPEIDLRHGEAVAIGLVFAAELAHRMGRIGSERVERHREVVSGYDLPVTLPPGADPGTLIGIHDPRQEGGRRRPHDGARRPGGRRGRSTASPPELVREVLQDLRGDR